MRSAPLRALLFCVLFPLSISLAVAQDDQNDEGGSLWDQIESGSNGKPASSDSTNGKERSRPSSPPPSIAAPERPPPLPDERPQPDTDTPSETASDAESDTDTDTESRPRGPTTAELLLQIDHTRFNIPMNYTTEVIQWVEWFTRGGRSTMRRWMGRSTLYKDMMQAELIRARIPTDVFYLAMIESGFYVHARSTAEAVGPWQFIEPTALQYELRVDEWVDERKDPLRSTQAATRYLRKLKNDFGNWYMAFAAYNAGEGLIFSAIRNYGTIDFFGLARVGALPDETRDYVPKMLAAAIVAKNPDVFGFDNVQYQPAITFEAVDVPAELTIDRLARSAKMSESDFRSYNPHLLADRLPSLPARQQIYLPVGMKREFYAGLRGMPSARASDGRRIDVAPEDVPDLSNHAKDYKHTVAEGETITAIAERYQISPAELRAWNDLDPTAEAKPGQVIRTAEPPPAGRWVPHKVSRGETLAAIAKRYGCSVDDLRNWNGLEPDVYRPAPDTVLWLETRLDVKP